MLNVLAAAERALSGLLRERPLKWQSLDIDYHPPRVERLWQPFELEGETYRIYLHKIYPCEPHEALFHPHPWPSAMRVVSGNYEMGIGYGTGIEPPPVAARMVVFAQSHSRDFKYEMTDPNAWHYVRPLVVPAWTVMVTGRPWNREAPSSAEPLKPLSPADFDRMINNFRYLY